MAETEREGMSEAAFNTEAEALTHKWAADLGGKDARVCLGAALNILSTIGLHSPPDLRQAMAVFLRRIAGEMEARRDQ